MLVTVQLKETRLRSLSVVLIAFRLLFLQEINGKEGAAGSSSIDRKPPPPPPYQ